MYINYYITAAIICAQRGDTTAENIGAQRGDTTAENIGAQRGASIIVSHHPPFK